MAYQETFVQRGQHLIHVREYAGEEPTIQVAPDNQGHRFLPKGKGIVFRQPSLGSSPGFAATGGAVDIWLQDLDSKTKTHLAHLTGRYATLSFDITPDGKRIVFDRVNDNSDIVLIDIPK